MHLINAPLRGGFDKTVARRLRHLTEGQVTTFMEIGGLIPQGASRVNGREIRMVWGNMVKDLGAPLWIRQLLSELSLEHDHSYTTSTGHPPFIAKLIEKLRIEAKQNVTAEDVLVGYGATQLMDLITMFTVNEKRAVFFPEYSYPPFLSGVRARNGKIYAYRVLPNGDPDTEHLKHQIEKAQEDGFRPTYVYVNSPQNPTGVIHSPESLGGTIAVVREFNLDPINENKMFIISDDVYHGLVMSGKNEKVIHPSSLLTEEDNGVVPILQLGSLSKEFGLCGARVGWTYFINCEGIDGMQHLKNGLIYALGVDLCAPSLYQELGARIVLETRHLPEMIAKIAARQDAVQAAFNREGIILGDRPEATFYWWMGIDPNFGTWRNDKEFARMLAMEQGVGFAPGGAFYCGEGTKKQFVRISLVEPPEIIAVAGERLDRFMEEHKR